MGPAVQTWRRVERLEMTGMIHSPGRLHSFGAKTMAAHIRLGTFLIWLAALIGGDTLCAQSAVPATDPSQPLSVATATPAAETTSATTPTPSPRSDIIDYVLVS